MGYRLVEHLEYGWDLAVQCEACGSGKTLSLADYLGPLRRYLNADVADLTKRLKCACGAQACRSSTRGGTYARFGMVSDVENGRARWIRQALTEAGLDPAAYGYPPIDLPPPPSPWRRG